MRISQSSSSIGRRLFEDSFRDIQIRTGDRAHYFTCETEIQILHNVVHSSEFMCNTIFSSHVLTEDTISREVKNGKLYSKRLLTKTNRVPKWGERFISKNIVKIMEESIVDPEAKTLTTYTRNLGYTKVMVGYLENKLILSLF